MVRLYIDKNNNKLYRCEKCRAKSERKALVKDKKDNKCCPNCKAPILISEKEFWKQFDKLAKSRKKVIKDDSDFCGRRKHE